VEWRGCQRQPDQDRLRRQRHRRGQSHGTGHRPDRDERETAIGRHGRRQRHFTLAFPPNPTDSLGLYLNGIRQEPGVDFTLSGSTITYTVPPKASDDQAARYHIFTVPDPPAPVTPPPPTTPPPSLGGGGTYYVDFTGGLDSNNGTSTGTAWKTVAKVNASSFSAGDNVLFKRGERGTRR
jgi:hypothetical protein